MGKKCICEICVCGRHRCPHRPSAWTRPSHLGPCVLSEYKQTYQQFDVRPRQSFKPPNKSPASTGKLETTTTHRNDYVAHRPAPRLSYGRTAEYVRSSDTMQGETEYMREYPEKRAVPLLPVRKWEACRAGQNDMPPFQASTTHKEDFRAWERQGVAKDNLKQFRDYVPPKEKFEAMSTFQTDYKANGPYVPREMVKPIQAVIQSETPFDDTTTNRVDYKVPPMGPRVVMKRAHPVLGKREKFDGTTTNRRDFISHTGIERPKCAKPSLEHVKSTEPISGQTTHNTSYVCWALQPRFEYPHQEYQPSPEKFDHISTNQSDFPDYGRIERVGPRTVQLVSHEPPPFTGVTTHRLDYQAWGIKPRDKFVRQGNAYKPQQGAFEGESTFQAHFRGEAAEPAKSAKPHEVQVVSSGQFDGRTIYRDTYTQKKLCRCPASFLHDNHTPAVKDRFVYSHQTGTGHKFYQSLADYKKDRLSKSMPEMTQA